jgi:hypothetical protein
MLWHSDAPAAYRTRVVGDVGQAGERQRMSLQRATCLSKNIRLCSYVLISLLQVQSDDN